MSIEAIGIYDLISGIESDPNKRARVTMLTAHALAVGKRNCVICSAEFTAEASFHALGVCWHCADVIYNLRGEYGGGKFPGWPNVSEGSISTKAVIPEVLRWEVFNRDNFECQSCGSRMRLCADHIHPESKGGETTLENLQTLCRSCNSKKGTKTDG